MSNNPNGLYTCPRCGEDMTGFAECFHCMENESPIPVINTTPSHIKAEAERMIELFKPTSLNNNPPKPNANYNAKLNAIKCVQEKINLLERVDNPKCESCRNLEEYDELTQVLTYLKSLL